MNPINALRFNLGYYRTTVFQLIISFISLWILRYFFWVFNIETYGNISPRELWAIMWYGIPFDLSAVGYFNIPFILIRFLPFQFVRRRGWIMASDIIFGVFNSLMLILNIADIGFVSFSGGRMRWGSLAGAMGDADIWGVLVSYARPYWWLYLFMVVYIAATLSVCYLPKIKPEDFQSRISRKLVLKRSCYLILAAAFTVLCIRGIRWRPLNVADAFSFVEPSRVDIVLNTPFSIVRTMKKSVEFDRVSYYSSEQLDRLRNDRYLFTEADTIPGIGDQRGKNIMFIIIESGGRQFFDTFSFVDGEKRRGLYTFIDSIASESLVNEQVMGTGLLSCNGLTSLFMGFPHFDPDYFANSSYIKNDFDTPVNLLREKGYRSKFYYGSPAGSFYIGQTISVANFDEAVFKDDYPLAHESESGWGIWDHDMAEYVAKDLGSLSEPFLAAWFTTNAHIPFDLPDKYAQSFNYPAGTPEATMAYTDMALRMFFSIARRQSWFANTVFVIIGDHGNRDFKGTVLDTPWIKYQVPLIIYTPDGSIRPRRISGVVMSQFDVTPTLMHIMGYDLPFISVGTDLFDTGKPHYGISRLDGQIMVTGPQYVIFTDQKGNDLLKVYDITLDQALSKPLTDYDNEETDRMLEWTRAFLQDYTSRIIDNRMSVRTAQ